MSELYAHLTATELCFCIVGADLNETSLSDPPWYFKNGGGGSFQLAGSGTTVEVTFLRRPAARRVTPVSAKVCLLFWNLKRCGSTKCQVSRTQMGQSLCETLSRLAMRRPRAKPGTLSPQRLNSVIRFGMQRGRSSDGRALA